MPPPKGAYLGTYVEAKHSDAPNPVRTRANRRLERDAFPIIGKRPIAETTSPELLGCLRRIEGRGHVETAHRVKTLYGQVFRYGISTGRVERDPTPDLRGALRPNKTKHYAALTDPKEVAELLRTIGGYGGQPTTIAALKLAPLVFTRPGELRQAKWADIDLEGATWTFEASKTGLPLIVPLSRQAVAILFDLHGLTGAHRVRIPRHPQQQASDEQRHGAVPRVDGLLQMNLCNSSTGTNHPNGWPVRRG